MLTKIKENELIKLFCDLVEIPSPSMKEEALIEWIEAFLKSNSIEYRLDNYKNIVINVPANDDKPSILLSSHLDVVGDNSPINLSLDGDFIQTDKKRTLGADNKAGVAICLQIAKEAKNFKHGQIEIVLTRDEEHGMSGINNVEFKKLNSKYALVLDADKLGQLLISGASYTNAILEVSTTFGGHSGLDIGDKKRLNSVKLISNLIDKIPQGVFYKDKTGTITSINIGCVIGGGVQNIVKKIADEGIQQENYSKYIAENSMTNVINNFATASYSIRSASVKKELELKNKIEKEVEKFNKKYSGLAMAKIEFSQHLQPFEKSSDDYVKNVHTKACAKAGVVQNISSFHAGAETHIYAHHKNAQGENFVPFLVGCADIFNMHSSDEKMDYKTFLKGYEIIKILLLDH